MYVTTPVPHMLVCATIGESTTLINRTGLKVLFMWMLHKGKCLNLLMSQSIRYVAVFYIQMYYSREWKHYQQTPPGCSDAQDMFLLPSLLTEQLFHESPLNTCTDTYASLHKCIRPPLRSLCMCRHNLLSVLLTQDHFKWGFWEHRPFDTAAQFIQGLRICRIYRSQSFQFSLSDSLSVHFTCSTPKTQPYKQTTHDPTWQVLQWVSFKTEPYASNCNAWSL